MQGARQAILAIDEGTSGTRAGLVGPDGSVWCVNHKTLALTTPHHGVVEQDPDDILQKTVDVCLKTIAEGAAAGIEIVALSLATQRATAVLWDTRTGKALVPAMVWQDARHAAALAQFSDQWNDRLVAATGRPITTRSPFLWAARHMQETPAVKAARAAGALAFGTVDTWLLWHLCETRRCVTTPTNAAAAGGYMLEEHRYFDAWLEAQSFPADLLPQLLQETDEFGHTRYDLLGIKVPVRASCGDQAGGIIGLGCLDAGQALCVHGTGSFFYLLTAEQRAASARQYGATVTTPMLRRHNRSSFAVETFVAATGAALNWMCTQMRWFDCAEEISQLASQVPTCADLTFLPALTGMRVPVMEPRSKGSLTGLSVAHGRGHLARAVLEGIAHSVVSCADASAASAGMEVIEVTAGGGLSASNVLLQIQADLGGVPVRRIAGAEHATLRGAAFLAGTDGLFWNDLAQTRATLPAGEYFQPSLDEAERLEHRARWNAIINQEIERAASHRRHDA